MSQRICQVCLEGHLDIKLYNRLIQLRGTGPHFYVTDLQYAVCDHCKSEMAGFEEMLHNKKRITDANEKLYTRN